MINKILALASKYVPVGIGIKGIGKIDPRLEKFFTAAALSGYGADEALSFIRNKLEGKTEANEQEERRLEQRGENLRPDELAAKQRIHESNRVPNAIQKALSVGAGALAGMGAVGEKPEVDIEEAQVESAPAPATGAANFIAQHPELGRYLDDLMQQGYSPAQAAEKAKQVRKLRPSIDDIEKKIGQDFVSLVSYLFGENQKAPNRSEPVQKSSGALSEALSMLRDLQSKIKASRG